jgi:thioester reductase-like protein
MTETAVPSAAGAPRRAVVLLTGATGFVGKVVLDELLRRRAALGVDKVLLLVRARDAERADARLRTEVLGSRCFAAQPAGFEKHVEALPGEITRPDLGLEPDALAHVRDEATHVVHCAASIEFSLPLAEAAAVNVDGARNALAVARSGRRIASFTSVSTAYVTPHPTRRPGPAPRIAEALVPLPADAETLHASIAAGAAREAALLRATGHPNTYTLTKCLAEHRLARDAGGLPITLVRPSIVSASRRLPTPGWIDSAAAFAAFVVLIATGRLRVVAADPDERLDIVPCDDVAARIVDAAFAPPTDGALRIRHAVAGGTGSLPLALCREVIERHFAPGGRVRLAWMGRRGARFRIEHALRHELPMRAAALWFALRREATAARGARRLLDAQRQLHRDFGYFTHATFDFESAVPLVPPLDPQSYLETVCAGVERHLLRGGRR